MTDKKGFTLVEILAVIVLLAVILIIIIPNISNSFKQSKESLRESKIRTIEIAASKYGNDEINKYKDCIGDGAKNNNNCTINIDSLINLGYVDADKGKNSIIDPSTNDAFSQNILLCYNPNDVSVTAIYNDNDTASCDAAAENTNNTLNLSSPSGRAYIGKNTPNMIEVGIISNGVFSSFDCNSSNTDLATCAVDRTTNKLKIKLNNSYLNDHSIDNFVNVEINLIGKYYVNENNTDVLYTLTKKYSLNVYQTILNVEAIDDETEICLQNDKSIELNITGSNYGTLNISNSHELNGVSATVKGNKLYLSGINDQTGIRNITLNEKNANTDVSIKTRLYKLNLGDVPKNLLVGASSEIVLVHSGTNIDNTVKITSSNTSVVSFLDKNNNKKNNYILSSGDTSFKIVANSTGTATITIDGLGCGSESFTVNVGNISIDSESVTLYAGGSHKSIHVSTDDSRLSCESLDTNIVTCEMDANLLKLYPTENSGSTTVNVFNENVGGRDSIIVNVINTSIQLIDENGNDLETLCVKKEPDAINEKEIYIIGDNIGDITYVENVNRPDDWYYADVTVDGHQINIVKRDIDVEVDGWNLGYNTGQAIFDFKESNGNKIDRLKYNIYTIAVENNNNEVNVGERKEITVKTSATGNITARLDNESFARIENICVISNNDCIDIDDYEYVYSVNLEVIYKITVKGLSVGNTELSINGTDCGNVKYDLSIIGNTYTLNLEKGTYTDRIENNINNLSCITTGSNLSCDVSLPGFSTSNELIPNGWSNDKDSDYSDYNIGDIVTLNDLNSGMTLYANSIDETPPICEFINLEDLDSINVGEYSELMLKCYDLGSGIHDYTNELNVDDFEINNPNIVKIVSVSSPNKLENINGYNYIITLEGLNRGNFKLSLTNNSVFNNFEIGNSLIETPELFTEGARLIESWNIGANNPSDVVASVFYEEAETPSYSLIITGEGEMKNFTFDEEDDGWIYAPWYMKYRDIISLIEIEENILNIGDFAFYGMTISNEIILPSSIYSIGESAFEYVTIPKIKLSNNDQFTKISEMSFANSMIDYLRLDSNIEYIGSSAFYNSEIIEFYLPNVKYIDSYAFKHFTSSSTILIPNTVQNISEGVFAYSSISLEFENGIELGIINTFTFGGAYIEELVLPDSITFIDDMAFANSQIAKIKLGKNLNKFGTDVFLECYHLQEIIVNEENSYYADVDGVLYSLNNNEYYSLVKCPSDYSKSQIFMPDSVKEISDYAFENNFERVLTSAEPISLYLSRDLEFVDFITNFLNFQISSYSISEENVNFYTDENGILYNKDKSVLYKVPFLYEEEVFDVPAYVTSIGEYSFYMLPYLNEVVIPYSVTTIGDLAFYSCVESHRFYGNNNYGIKKIYINSSSLNLGFLALDIYDISMGINTDINKFIYVYYEDLYNQILDLDYIDNNYLKVEKLQKTVAKDYILKNKEHLVRDDFTIALTENTTGKIFEAVDDDGTTYYYAGAPDDNYVRFAGFYWRIIRINGNGSIRMIYTGETNVIDNLENKEQVLANGYNDSGNYYTRIKKTSAFNSTSDNNMYVGFKYLVNGIEKKSTILEALETWYTSEENDLQEYEEYLDKESGFCGDRSSYTSANGTIEGGGTGNTKTYYGSYIRNITKNLPSFKCSDRQNNLYTIGDSSVGNKLLDFPVGLITADEVVFAGGGNDINNDSYYLYTGDWYWSISPGFFNGSYAFVFSICNLGNLCYGTVSPTSGIRPVINLRADISLTGEGTIERPYAILD